MLQARVIAVIGLLQIRFSIFHSYSDTDCDSVKTWETYHKRQDAHI